MTAGAERLPRRKIEPRLKVGIIILASTLGTLGLGALLSACGTSPDTTPNPSHSGNPQITSCDANPGANNCKIA